MVDIVFGPIISRRFGISLGVDLSPFNKQCNFDCLYCELQPKKAMCAYSEILPLDVLINSVKTALEKNPNIDVLTITANGEPTLYPHLEDFIIAIKPFLKAKSLILSNGSLFGESSAQRALSHFDIVKFSLDSGDTKSFRKVDRPHKSLDLESIKNGIRDFARMRDNMLVCEILVVQGVNDDIHSMQPLADFLREIQVDRIDLSTIDRPPAYRVQGVSYAKLHEISKIFSGLFVSIPFRQNKDSNEILSNATNSEILLDLNEKEILDLLQRRPLDFSEVNQIFSPKSVESIMNLFKQGKIKQKKVGLIDFYTL